MKDTRPVNLSLTTMRFPVTAIVSILHRLSGLLIFLSLPFMLYDLQQALASPIAFEHVQQCLQCGVVKLLTWAILSALAYHVLAGIRHIFMDFGFGEGRCSGRYTAWALLVVAAIVIVMMGWCIWR